MGLARFFVLLVALACGQAPAAVNLSPAAQRGREVFLYQSAPTCGTCHVLQEARTKGRLGPDLDELQADYDRVLRAVTQGVEAMPSQRGILTPEQIDAVARYVVEAAAADP